MVFGLIQKRLKYSTTTVRINGRRIRLLIADTMLKRAIGLMYRESIEPGTGMLFRFRSSGKYGIWMRNMRFPIDVIWIDKQKVVSVEANLKNRDGKIHYPTRPADTVIELSAGSVKKYKIKEGKKIDLKG